MQDPLPSSEQRSRSGPGSVSNDGASLSPEMLRRVAERDPEALEVFFDTYFDRIYQVAFRLSGTREGAEDLTQEVFLRVQRSVGTLDPKRNPWPWMLTIVHNLFRDSLRSPSREKPVGVAPFEALETRERPESGPEGALLQKERARMVQKALKSLPDLQRMVIVLRDYEGLSHQEIAPIVDLSPMATRKCYSRAIAALGRTLKEVLQ